MSSSYPNKSRGANAPVVSPAPAPSRARGTATFVPYYWEAYNEIVKPHRFNHYLITRWLPDLGRTGFAIVLVLRDRCYYDRHTGALRNKVEIKMDELAKAVDVGRTTLFREFERNEVLKRFVTYEPRFDTVGGHPQQVENLFTISMDDPIHPDDLDKYEELRALKEIERMTPPVPTPPGKKRRRMPDDIPQIPEYQNGTLEKAGQSRAENRGYQNGTLGTDGPGREYRFETPDAMHLYNQNGTPDATHLPSQNCTAIDKFPSGGLYTSLNTLPGAAAPPINSPQGEAESVAECLRAWEAVQSTWDVALTAIQSKVNKPTFESHMRALRPLGFEGTSETETFVLLVASAFNREWVEKRYTGTITTAVSDACGRDVAVRFTLVAPGEEKGRP